MDPVLLSDMIPLYVLLVLVTVKQFGGNGAPASPPCQMPVATHRDLRQSLPISLYTNPILFSGPLCDPGCPAQNTCSRLVVRPSWNLEPFPVYVAM